MIRWLVDHATTILIAVAVIFVGGMSAYLTLPREAAPDITIPVVTVTTVYAGVSPKDVESLVTIPIENKLSGLRDMKKLSSTSGEGVSVIAAEFEPDVVIEDALQRVRDRVSQARADLPDDVDDPQVHEIAFSDIPILIVTVAGDVDEEVLKQVGKDLEEDVGKLPGVLEAKLSGGLTRQIRVEIDPVRLAHYGLSLRDVVDAIHNENVNIPGGTVDTAHSSVLFRVPGAFADARQVEDVAIKRIGESPVFVRDVGRVVDGYEDRATYARMNGQTAVSLSVTKRPGENIVQVTDRVKAEVSKQARGWPDGVRYRALADQSKNIKHMVSELQNNIITALLLVVAVMVVFMGFRSSAFVASAIPLSMLSSFLVLQLLGFTLNMIVLFSLILALGMLVDNAIVVVENIYRHAEEGKDLRTAAIDGTKEVAGAVAASTATTVVAFFPLVFWSGVMGQFMGYLPKTLIIVLTASLVVAIGVMPVALSRFMGRPKQITDADHDTDDLAPLRIGPFMRAYKAVLEFSIKHRYVSLGLMGALLLATFGIYGVFNHGTEFFPSTDPDSVTVRVMAPDGTAVQTTDQIVRRVEEIVAAQENVDVYVSEVGVSAAGDALRGSQAVPNEAKVTVDFLPDRNDADPGEKVRIEPTPDTITRLREALKKIPGVRIQVESRKMGPPVGAPVSVEVSGDDYDQVGAFAQKFRREIAQIPGVTDLKDDYKIGRPELRLRIDRAAAKRVGVSTATIGDTVRNAVAGTKASSLRDGNDDYDIVVRVAPEDRQDVASILDLRVPGRTDRSPDTFPVPLSTVASYQLAGGTGAIRHIDQDLVVTISGDVLDGFNENQVRGAVQKLIDKTDAGKLHLTLSGANDEQQKAASFLIRALLIAIALIAMVLVTQFDSVAIPLIIMASVVLSLIGVLWGLLLTGTSFGIIMTGIGVISLAGVVVNNAIVLLDYVGQLRERGLDSHDALIRAGITRFRPVMLTAGTTVLGLVPMAVGISVDFTRLRVLLGGASAQFWGPMSIAVIFGLGFATLLTLVMVPTMYSILQDAIGAWEGFRSRRALRHAAGTAAKILVVGLLGLGVAGQARAATLAEAVKAAETNNIPLQVLQEQTYQSGLARGQAWASVQPRLTGNVTYNFNQYDVVFDPAAIAQSTGVTVDSQPIVIQSKRYWTAMANVQQPLLDARAFPGVKAAYAMADAASEQQVEQRNQIVSGVARAYYSVGVARKNVEVTEASLKARQDGLKLAQRQAEAGLAPKRAVIQAQLAVSQAKRALAQAQEGVVKAQQAFTRATGLPPQTPVDPPQDFTAPGSVDEALKMARASRPDLVAVDRQIDAAKLQHRAVLLEWIPTINGSFTWQFNQNTGFSGKKSQWMAGISATWNPWDGGMRLQRARQASSQERIAELQAEDRHRAVEQDVRTAWESYQRADAAVAEVKDEVSLADESLELAKRGFQAGDTTFLELQDAEVDLRMAQLAQIQEEMNRTLAIIDLQVAMGTSPI